MAISIAPAVEPAMTERSALGAFFFDGSAGSVGNVGAGTFAGEGAIVKEWRCCRDRRRWWNLGEDEASGDFGAGDFSIDHDGAATPMPRRTTTNTSVIIRSLL